MPKYRVYLSEINTYSIDVEASDEQAAMEVGRQALCDAPEPTDYLNDLGLFEVDDAVEIIDDAR